MSEEQVLMFADPPVRTRADQLFEKFKEFHEKNPHVWELFKRFTFEVINRGFENYSSKSVCERIRWHTTVETSDKEFKLCNNHTAYYARLFHAAYPEHEGFFRNKKRISEDRAESMDDTQVIEEPGDESDLMEKLKELI